MDRKPLHHSYDLNQVCRQEPSKFVRIPLCVQLACLAQQTFVYQTLAFPPPCELPSFSLKSQTMTTTLSFVFSWRWYFRWELQSFWPDARFSWVSLSLLCVCVCVCLHLVSKSCPTLCDPMDCNLPGSSIHGIFQARILRWVAISFSRASSAPRDGTHVSCIAGRFFTTKPGKPHVHLLLIFCLVFSC